MDALKEVYRTLSADAALTALLADGAGGVLADLTDYSGRYPVVVYSLISDVPVMFGDDMELGQRLTVQISIVTDDGDDAAIAAAVINDLTAIAWTRYSTNRITDGDKRITAIRFVLEKESR